jgi:hypothetical protein
LLDKAKEVVRGNKINLPFADLQEISIKNLKFPLTFTVRSMKNNKSTCCGSLNFLSEGEGLHEEEVQLPLKVMQNLEIEPDDIVLIDYVALQTATYAKFQAQSVDFLKIVDPKAVLEQALATQFTCLSEGEMIEFKDRDRIYELLVTQVRPEQSCRILDCDLVVDFEQPVGYIEPGRMLTFSGEFESPSAEELQSNLFPGAGHSLVSSVISAPSPSYLENPSSETISLPNRQPEFVPFSGTPHSLNEVEEGEEEQTDE